ncbi:DNA cytosine methyltransferase [Ruminococcaceae bacterium OttesenSCG-928-L11]|nr:DNA cytosine methyltransferase [Ruminococcaceae bacterium OttesenSCG-928-L11]
MNKNKPLSLGSLFDGIGGFPYAGTFFGITPMWASEILPSAVSVTKRHLPNMAHVGDITKLHGAELPPVDIVTFGSPCQGLSYAGKRLGMADERSGLFTEAIRIIKEMREATNGVYPRYALWENVPGALSSGKPAGSDFQAVLEAFTEAEVPFPRSGRWANAGMVRGGGVDLAWCVYNAQHFGTAQRRRRIFLIVDFGGGCAGEVLFVPKSLRGYFAAGGTPRQGPAAYAPGRTDGADHSNDNCLTPWDVQSRRIHSADGTWPALYGGPGGGRGYCLNPWDTQQSRVTVEDGIAPTLAGADGGGGRNPAGLVMTAAFSPKAGSKARSIGYEEERSPTLTRNTPSVVCLNDQGGDRMDVEKGKQAPTLRSVTKGNLPVICAATGQANAEVFTDLCPTITEAAGTSGNKPYIICRATALANAEILEDKSATLTCYHEQPIICKAIHQNQVGDISTSDQAYTLSTASNASARNAPLVMTEAYGINATAIGRLPHNGGNGLGVQKEISPTLTATDRHGVASAVHPDVSGTLCASGAGTARSAGMANEADLCVAYCLQGSVIGRENRSGPNGSGVNKDVSFTLNTRDHHGVAAVDCRNFRENSELSGTLQAKESGGYSLNSQNPVRAGYIVRRLTPTEAERLQGYPDGWTALDENGKPISDSKRYMMLGNSIATPCAAYILQAMAEQLRKGEA